MPDFNTLGPLMKSLHQEFVSVYYLMLPVFFALSIATTWLRSPQGSIEFVDSLKRAFIATLLLASFPEVSQLIVSIADGITVKVDAHNSLDRIIQMAKTKSQGYSLSPTSILLQFNDLIVATLSFLSYLVLYVARYITVAMYYFFWVFLTATAPLLILFTMFRSTSQITVNLYRGMIEVASWKIVWAVLGAMLTALSFSDIYQVEGNYITLIVMNFVIAVAMLATPLMVRSIVGSGVHAMSTALGSATVAAMSGVPVKALRAFGKSPKAAFSSAPFYPRAHAKSSTTPNTKKLNSSK
jgi:hypothetical protein